MTDQTKKVLKIVFAWATLALALLSLGGLFGAYNVQQAVGSPEKNEAGLQDLVNSIKASIEYFKLGGENIITGIQIGLPAYVHALVLVISAITLLVGIIIHVIGLVKLHTGKESKLLGISTSMVGFGALAYVAALYFMYFTKEIAAGQVVGVSTIGWGGLMALIGGALNVALLAAASFFFVPNKSNLVKGLRAAVVVLCGVLAVTLAIGTFSQGDTTDYAVASPYTRFLYLLSGLMPSGGSAPGPEYTRKAVIFIVLTVFIAAASGFGKSTVEGMFGMRVNLKKRNEKNYHPYAFAMAMIVVGMLFFVGSTVAVVVMDESKTTSLSVNTIINYVLLGVVLGLVIACAILDKSKPQEAELQSEPAAEAAPVENGEPDEPAMTPSEEEYVQKEAAVAAVVAADAISDEPKEESQEEKEAPSEEPVKEEKPAKEEKAQPKEKKAAPAKKAEAKKEAPKKEEKKEASAKKAPAKKEEPKEERKEVNFRTYHLVKRDDGKWEVKYAGGQKAIKLFGTQKEALEYSKKMAENQGGKVLVHNSKGENKGRIQKKR